MFIQFISSLPWTEALEPHLIQSVFTDLDKMKKLSLCKPNKEQKQKLLRILHETLLNSREKLVRLFCHTTFWYLTNVKLNDSVKLVQKWWLSYWVCTQHKMLHRLMKRLRDALLLLYSWPKHPSWPFLSTLQPVKGILEIFYGK